MRNVLKSLLFVTVLVSRVALAVGQPFDRAEFDALQKAGKPVLVLVHADWCPTCRAQTPLISDLLKQPQFSRIAALRVDFDQQRDAVKSFNVTQQSTLIVFKGGHEVGRSVGDTQREGIEALLKKAL